jgi:hypothetical protein
MRHFVGFTYAPVPTISQACKLVKIQQLPKK